MNPASHSSSRTFPLFDPNMPLPKNTTCKDMVMTANEIRWHIPPLSLPYFDQLTSVTFPVFDAGKHVGNAVAIFKGDGKTLLLSSGEHDPDSLLQINNQPAVVLFLGTSDAPFCILEISEEFPQVVTLDISYNEEDLFLHLYHERDELYSKLCQVGKLGEFNLSASNGAPVISLSCGTLMGIHHQNPDENLILHTTKIYAHLMDVANNHAHHQQGTAADLLSQLTFKNLDLLPPEHPYLQRTNDPCNEAKEDLFVDLTFPKNQNEVQQKTEESESKKNDTNHILNFLVTRDPRHGNKLKKRQHFVSVCYEKMISDNGTLGIQVWKPQSKLKAIYSIKPSPPDLSKMEKKALYELFARAIWKQGLHNGTWPNHFVLTKFKKTYTLTNEFVTNT